MSRRCITVTSRTPNAVQLIQDALQSNKNVMACTNGQWFRVNLFKVLEQDGYEFWYATPVAQGYKTPGPLLVKTLNWFE